ncbi:hypothetical protein [Butyrivibrio sp. INlla14]|uniref:hypothetical protein n=1 Tax=Butyrivibrio sp. INlla14 TaxID=1520808 RepID=UPI0008768A38|nr:hypothetical protein [Butyrivibrio sp. INlla14]SCY47435.1 hypothetical protein SAMN02910371_02446 [Butyrivibrio sp. INlla14]
MSLIISNKLEHIIDAIDENAILKENFADYRERLKTAKDNLTMFQGTTAETFRARYNEFMDTDAGVFPSMEKQLEKYNEHMEVIRDCTSQLIDRCNHFADTLTVGGYTAAYSEGKEEGSHVFFDDLLLTIKAACNSCITVDEDELTSVKKAVSILEDDADVKELCPSPISGLTDSMTTCIEKQDSIANFRDSLDKYGSISCELEEYAETNFNDIIDTTVSTKYPYPEGVADSETIRQKLKNNYDAATIYILDDNGKQNLQNAMDNWDNLSDEDKKIVIAVYDISADYVTESYDEGKAEPYISAMETITASFIVFNTCKDSSGNIYYSMDFNKDRMNEFYNNLDPKSEASSILVELSNSDYIPDGKMYSEPAARTLCDISFDKAGIRFTIHNYNSDAVVGDDVIGDGETFDAIYYTSQERSTGYINLMMDQDSSYADHLRNDLGYDVDSLATLLTSAENTYDMAVLESLVNADDGYNGVFDTDPSKLTEQCATVLATYSYGLLDSGKTGEFSTFVNEVLNTEGTDEHGKYIKGYADKLAEGYGVLQQTFASNAYEQIVASGGIYDKNMESSLTSVSNVMNFWGGISHACAEYDEGGWFHSNSFKDSTALKILDADYSKLLEGNGMDFKVEVFSDKVDGKSVFASNTQYHASINNDDGLVMETDELEFYKKSVNAANKVAYDTVASVVGKFCPVAGTVMKGVGDVYNSASVWTWTSDGAKEGNTLLKTYAGVDNKMFSNSVTTVGDIMGGIGKLQSISNDLQKFSDRIGDYQNVDLYCSYNEGTDSVSICDYAKIYTMYQWNQEGLEAIVGQDDSQMIRDELFDSNNSNLVSEETYTEIMQYVDPSYENSNQSAFLTTNYNYYTQEQVSDAMNVIINGSNGIADNASYKSINDIPLDLMNACVLELNEEVYKQDPVDDQFGAAASANRKAGE